MVEEIFLGVKESPKNVLKYDRFFFWILRVGEGVIKFRYLGFIWIAGQCLAIKRLYDFLRWKFVADHFFDNFATNDTVVHGVAIEKVERLGKIGFHFYFA